METARFEREALMIWALELALFRHLADAVAGRPSLRDALLTAYVQRQCEGGARGWLWARGRRGGAWSRQCKPGSEAGRSRCLKCAGAASIPGRREAGTRNRKGGVM